jgi:ribonucleotide monophosphatase NagD (HAD superfamily)
LTVATAVPYNTDIRTAESSGWGSCAVRAGEETASQPSGTAPIKASRATGTPEEFPEQSKELQQNR